ncbi:hemolysin family protein [Luteimonas sp. RD2P54]|uniref:Hemolysin family protein n=1 Tax=Luteimonas endophytica TaxID=3042023 RepID=A0ABT6JAZ1_9GAMM|nr:hemolysin family protein [Luteimonas endophytica]MDH5823924.1 hemolysin family protein [Luteimonas endophytica]
MTPLQAPWIRRWPWALCVLLLPGAALAVTVSGDATGRSGTPMDVALLVIYLGGAIGLSFLCSIAESVLLSITPSYIEGLRETRPQLADALRRLRLDSVDQSLAAILTLNTIAHTVGAVGSGAQATIVFGSAWVGVFSAVATLLILFLSEIVPKTLGAVHWRALAGPVAGFVRALILMLYPLIKVSELLTRLVSRGKQTHVFSRDEFIAMAGVGEKAGHIDPRESRILRNLFRMSSLKARDVMTPRPVVAGMQRDATVSQALRNERAAPFSRIPLYAGDRDDIDGFVLRDELLQAEARGDGEVPLDQLKRELLSVPDSMPLSNLLEFLLDRRQQIALVVGEYGDVQGLVTMEDVVETLLGDEIVDEMDRDADMQRLARERWEKRISARGLRLPGRSNQQ